jgi:hypothetical protein
MPGGYFFCKNRSGSTPACLRMARSVPSGMSPGMPGLVTARGLAMEHEPEGFESPGDVAIPKTPEPSHQVATMSGRSSDSAAVGRFVAA